MNTAQLEFQAEKTGATQCEKILARLQQTPGQLVSMQELYEISGAHAVHSRISDLRAMGHNIPPPHLQKMPTGAMHSFYRLEPAPAPISPIRQILQTDAPFEASPYLPTLA